MCPSRPQTHIQGPDLNIKKFLVSGNVLDYSHVKVKHGSKIKARTQKRNFEPAQNRIKFEPM